MAVKEKEKEKEKEKWSVWRQTDLRAPPQRHGHDAEAVRECVDTFATVFMQSGNPEGD
ncbi:hypothetical protein ACFVEN_34960 [Streptomyces sp. NPDC057681]|uniref:hypothetical protein n=1 Tax=Streptomyces sp. NPDC057681 TaxID=3346209 RepID=UPI0036B48BB9